MPATLQDCQPQRNILKVKIVVVDWVYDALNISGHLHRFLQWAWKIGQILLRGSNFGLKFFKCRKSMYITGLAASFPFRRKSCMYLLCMYLLCIMYIYMYMYVYLRFYGAWTSQVIGSCNEWLRMIMMAKWYSGTLRPKASRHLSYRWGKTPRKTSPRKLVPTGDRIRAHCVTGAYATDCPTAVDEAEVILRTFTLWKNLSTPAGFEPAPREPGSSGVYDNHGTTGANFLYQITRPTSLNNLW